MNGSEAALQERDCERDPGGKIGIDIRGNRGGCIVAGGQTVTAAFVNVHFKGHTVSAQCTGIIHGVFNRHNSIFHGMPDESGNGLGRDALFQRKLFDELLRGIFTQVLADGKFDVDNAEAIERCDIN